MRRLIQAWYNELDQFTKLNSPKRGTLNLAKETSTSAVVVVDSNGNGYLYMGRVGNLLYVCEQKHDTRSVFADDKISLEPCAGTFE